jgi:hypothetical protein
VYERLEQDTVSPAATVNPFVIEMSEPEAATWQWITTVPPDVWIVAVATGEALPAAFVSLVIAFAVAVPPLDAAKPVDDITRVAAAAPGEPTVPEVRNTRRGEVPSKPVTALVAASRAAVVCVTAILFFLVQFGLRCSHHFHGFGFARGSALDLQREANLAGLALKL